ncbi:thermonuclease family protein [Arthrobacter sp. M4]|uniref:thermonuclease family protein n=1 Tax=Arthrobacter sp. M4 TaxID=218160 RepID=UPI001CDCBFBF|nr:thermonuclease family protein [Arthrobacter sp. M4]
MGTRRLGPPRQPFSSASSLPDGPRPDCPGTNRSSRERTQSLPPIKCGRPFPITSVTDGDTIRVTINGKSTPVRLIGIDTPEVTDPRKPVQCFGQEASRRAHELLDGTQVWLEYDPTQARRDRYGRPLAYVWLNDTELINLCGYRHRLIYAEPATMPRHSGAVSRRRCCLVFHRQDEPSRIGIVPVGGA